MKSEALNLAVIDELPLVIIDVQRGGPSTGLPTKSEQTDLLQVLYGRNGESPMPVIAATSPTDCFDAAFAACKMALEHMTPVILLTDAFIANGSSAWKLPKLEDLPEIRPHYATDAQRYKYTPYKREEFSNVRIGLFLEWKVMNIFLVDLRKMVRLVQSQLMLITTTLWTTCVSTKLHAYQYQTCKYKVTR